MLERVRQLAPPRLRDFLNKHGLLIMHLASATLVAAAVNNEPAIASMQSWIIAIVVIMSLAQIEAVKKEGADPESHEDLTYHASTVAARFLTKPSALSWSAGTVALVACFALWLFSYSADVPCDGAKGIRWKSLIPRATGTSACESGVARVHGVAPYDVSIQRTDESGRILNTCRMSAISARPACQMSNVTFAVGAFNRSMIAVVNDVSGSEIARELGVSPRIVEGGHYSVNRAATACSSPNADVVMIDEPWVRECASLVHPIRITDIGFHDWRDFSSAFGPRLADFVRIGSSDQVVAVPFIRNVTVLWTMNATEMPAGEPNVFNIENDVQRRHWTLGVRSNSPNNASEMVIQLALSRRTPLSTVILADGDWPGHWLQNNRDALGAALAEIPGNPRYRGSLTCASDKCDAENLVGWLSHGNVHAALGWINWTSDEYYLSSLRQAVRAIPIDHPLSGTWLLGITRHANSPDEQRRAVAFIRLMIGLRTQRLLASRSLLPALESAIENEVIGGRSMDEWYARAAAGQRPHQHWDRTETEIHQWLHGSASP